jgi:hypothetical protein
MNTLGRMTTSEILLHRVHNQRLRPGRPGKPADVVRWLGAVQAQDYAGSLWAVGQRAGRLTDADVEQAVSRREIVRTWPMRGTLHFVAPENARWMLALLTPRIVARTGAMRRRLEIDQEVLARAANVISLALRGGRLFTRNAVYRLLESARISTEEQRGLHIIWLLAQDGLLCFGPRQGKQHTFALLEEWLPGLRSLPRDEALATLAERYFESHGPATVKDFAWWSGLALGEAKAGLEAAKSRLFREDSGGASYWMKSSPRSASSRGGTGTAARRSVSSSVPGVLLLPAFDEYMVGYADREAALEEALRSRPISAAEALSPLIVRGGRAIGTWKRVLGADGVTVTPSFFAAPTRKDLAALEEAARAYGEFLGLPAALSEHLSPNTKRRRGRSNFKTVR